MENITTADTRTLQCRQSILCFKHESVVFFCLATYLI